MVEVGPSAARAAAPRALEEVAGGFEAFLLRALMKSMRAALPRGGLPGGGRGGEVFTGLLDARLAEPAAGRGRGRGLGLGAMVLERYAAAAEESKGRTLDLRAGSSH